MIPLLAGTCALCGGRKALLGVDSLLQGFDDWEAVAADNIQFAMLRIGCGSTGWYSRG